MERTTLTDWMLSLYHDNGGKVTKEIVLEAARPIDSPAHGFVFNVDADEASELYYLERAHRLIQTVRIRYVDRPQEEPRFIRVFHAVRDDTGEPVFVTHDDLIRKPDLLVQARTAAVGRVRDAERALDDLDTLAMGTVQAGATSTALKSVRKARRVLESIATD